MSWFSEMASKAEAMLVRLDQDAAQALQDPDVILRGTKIIDQALNTITRVNNTDHQSDEQQPLVTDEPDTSNSHLDFEVAIKPSKEPEETAQDKPAAHVNANSSNQTEKSNQPHSEVEPKLIKNSEQEPVNIKPQIPDRSNNETKIQDFPTDKINTSEAQTSSSQKSRPEFRQQTRKFKLQTSKLQRPDRKSNSRFSTPDSGYPSANGVMESSSNDTKPTSSLGADDIRASINRSLQEYSFSSSVSMYPGSTNGATVYSSHFDNQPNLVQISPSTEHGLPNDKLSGRGRNSNSFSIDLSNSHSSPNNNNNNNNYNSPSSDIASRLIKQASTRKSTFSIHQVINRLANQNGHSSALVGESTKLKFRRAQMRAASYARRLNYYFRAYPTMKYWIVAYIVIMQLLVVYVLFFYQSNTSYTYLTSQVNQQQQVLAEKKNQ